MKRLVFLLILMSTVLAKGQIGLATRAFRAMEAGNLTEAKAKIDEALKDELTKKHKRAWYYRGRIYEEAYVENQNVQWANWSMEGYMMAMELGMDPHTDVKDRFHKMGERAREDGVKKFKQKKFEDAEKFFIASMTVAKWEERVDSLNYLNVAISNVKMQRYDRALSYLDTCMEIGFQPQSVAKYSLMIYRKKGDQRLVDKKIASYRDMYPENHELLMLEIENHLQQGREKEAVASASKSVKKYPENAGLLVVRGELQLRLGHAPEAEKDFLLAVSKNPKLFDAQFALGQFYEKKNVKKAIPYYEAAYAIDPNKDNVGKTLLNAYQKAQEYNKYNRLKPKVK